MKILLVVLALVALTFAQTCTPDKEKTCETDLVKGN